MFVRAIDRTTEQKQMQSGLALITQFLESLEAVTSVKPAEQNGSHELIIQYSSEAKEKRIVVVTDDGKTEGLFAETLITSRPHQSYITKASVGLLFASQADYLFYLSGNVLYTLPLVKFRYWVDHNSDAFRQECFYENANGCELRHHGLFVPRQRLRSDFAKGDVRVSVFRLKVSHDAPLDYIQEF